MFPLKTPKVQRKKIDIYTYHAKDPFNNKPFLKLTNELIWLDCQGKIIKMKDFIVAQQDTSAPIGSTQEV